MCSGCVWAVDRPNVRLLVPMMVRLGNDPFDLLCNLYT